MTLSGTLWIILASPLGAALALFALGRRLGRRAVATIAIASASIALGAAIYHAARLHELPPPNALAQHLWRLVRVGQLDASVDLAMDPLAAVAAVAVAAIGFLGVTWTALRSDAEPRVVAGLCLCIASLSLVVLSGNLVVMLLGWQGALVAALLAGPARARSAAYPLAGDACFVAGAALLYWGMGGAFASGTYVTDLSPRFVASRPEPSVAPSRIDDDDDEPRASPGTGFLTLTSYPGAVLFLDESRAPLMRGPDEPLRAPFVRFPVRSGRHQARIHAGGGQDDYLVRASVADGAECVLSLRGPSVSFAEMKPELADSPLARSPTTAAFACLLLFFGVAAKVLRATTRASTPGALAQTLVVVAGVYALARLGFVFALAPVTGIVMVVVGGLVAVLAATSGLFEDDIERALGRAGLAYAGILVAALGTGNQAGAMATLVAYAPAMAVLVIAARSRLGRAYVGGAVAASIAPLPLFAGLGVAHAIALGAATACAAFVVWRVYYVALAASRRARGGGFVLVAAAGVVAGAALGFGQRLDVGAVAASAGASLAGFAIARARYGSGDAKTWAARDRAAPGYALLRDAYHLGRVYDGAVEAPVLSVARLVGEMERWVVAGLADGAALLVRASAWTLAALDDGVLDAAPRRVADVTVRFARSSRFFRADALQTCVYVALATAALAALLTHLVSLLSA